MYPLLFEWGGSKIFSYPLFVGMAWGLAYKMCLADRLLMRQGSFQGLFWGTFLFSWLGAKKVFLLVNGHFFGGYWGMLDFWSGGGFVFYGGLCYGFLYIVFYSVVLKKFPKECLGRLLPPLAAGHALGRVGCFLAGCCYGTVCDLPWAVHLHGQYRHPVPLYEAAFLVLLSAAGYGLSKNKVVSWNIIGFYFAAYAAGRFVLEFFRGDAGRGVYFWGLSSGQIASLAFAVTGALLMMLDKRKKDHLSV